MTCSLLFLSVIAAVLVLHPSDFLHAQGSSIPCGLDSGAIHRADIPIDYEVPPQGDEPGLQSNIWHFDESIWLMPGGRTTFVLDAASLHFIGPTGGGVDLLSFASIIDILALEGVRQGVDAGFSLCGDTVSVLVNACVTRLGQGPATTFVPCGPECCTRTFRIVCPIPGITLILPVHESNSICRPIAGGCEQGCDGLLPIP